MMKKQEMHIQLKTQMLCIVYYHGDECPFAEPFILNDGTTSYSAKVEDIDWE